MIGLRLRPAENLGSTLPREDLHLSLCENSLRSTLIADRRVYWAEITPLLQRWQSVNNTGCPHCHHMIRVNMSRHLRASHTDNQCFWRCPVSTCHMWFRFRVKWERIISRGYTVSERDRDAHSMSVSGVTGWSGLVSAATFDQREQSSQAMWMDIALARQSGQELQNHYIITNSPATAHIRRFFHASIRRLTSSYQRIAADQAFYDIRLSICDQMRSDMAAIKEECDPPRDEASGDTHTMVTDMSTRQSPVVDPPHRSSTNNNRSLAVMEASTLEAPHCHIPIARGAVNFTSIASLDLQTFIDPLPLDQLLCYSSSTVHSWSAEDRDQILAVANRDMTIARRNLAELTHAAHLAACAGASDDSIPLMAAETYPRLPGGIGAALQEMQRDKI